MPSAHPRSSPRSRSSAPAFKVGRTNPPTLTAVSDTESLELIFRALGNETRLEILSVLHDWGSSMSSHDIARRFDTTWQGISRHLRILTEAGVLDCEVWTNQRSYSLNKSYLRRIAGRWIMRVATEGTRNKQGRLVFDFGDDGH
jgi:DNA-binding transcriptional ArsR family regulator